MTKPTHLLPIILLYSVTTVSTGINCWRARVFLSLDYILLCAPSPPLAGVVTGSTHRWQGKMSTFPAEIGEILPKHTFHTAGSVILYHGALPEL
jgi:hypothetical protein